MANGDDNQQRIVINFIDPLFSVVLSMSFAQVYAEAAWFKNFWLIWKEPHFFEVATLVLIGYLTVILSWVGYHRSIKSSPINVDAFWGRWRFGLDIVLLISYFVLLVSYVDFHRELWTLASVYFLFFVWDQMKRLETLGSGKKEAMKSAQRRGVTVLWFFLFLALALLYQFCPVEWPWAAFGAALLGTILYRLQKEKLWPKSLLISLAYPRPE